jgi:MFS family permease
MLKTIRSTSRRFFNHPLFPSFYLPSFLWAVAMGIRNTILPLYVGQLSQNYSLIGLVVAGASLGTLVMDIPAGFFIQKLNKRFGMILGLTVDGLCTLGLIWARSIWVALALQLLSGIAMSVFIVSRHTYITNAARQAIRGRAISLFGGVVRVGTFVGPIIGGQVATHFGLRLPFAAYAFVIALTISVLILSGDKFQEEETLGEPVTEEKVKLREALRGDLSVLIFASLGNFLAAVTRVGQGLILPLWGADILMLTPAHIGWAVSLSAGVSMTLFYPVGLMMDRMGRKKAIVPSFVVMGVGLALLSLTQGYTAYLLLAALIGLGHGLGSGTMMTLGADLSPEKGRSAFLGAWRWITDAGSSSGPLIVGAVASVFLLPGAAIAIALSGLLAGGVFGFLVPETLGRRQKRAEV